MKKLLILSIIIISISLTGCSSSKNSEPPKKEVIKYKGDTAIGITMTIKEGTLTNNFATVIIKDLSGKENIYGNDFELYKNTDNEWIAVPLLVENTFWELRGYHVNENNLLEMEQYWGGYWGNLPPGCYKLVKGASLSGEMQVYTFSVDFTIEAQSRK